MERLTKRMGGISYSLCDNVIIAKCENCNHRMPSCYDEDCQAELDVTTRLAAYEDTGLTPEEIGRMRWIPVSERLPDKDQWCHIAIKTKHGYRVENDLFAVETADRFGHDHGFCKRKEEITHWMPYPEPPKEENDARI